MIRRILSEDESEAMPPPETKKHLTAEQKETLVRWIKEGAEYQPHWSLIAPTRPTPPVSTASTIGFATRSTPSSSPNLKQRA